MDRVSLRIGKPAASAHGVTLGDVDSSHNDASELYYRYTALTRRLLDRVWALQVVGKIAQLVSTVILAHRLQSRSRP